jgi:hypothetical protein
MYGQGFCWAPQNVVVDMFSCGYGHRALFNARVIL